MRTVIILANPGRMSCMVIIALQHSEKIQPVVIDIYAEEVMVLDKKPKKIALEEIIKRRDMEIIKSLQELKEIKPHIETADIKRNYFIPNINRQINKIIRKNRELSKTRMKNHTFRKVERI